MRTDHPDTPGPIELKGLFPEELSVALAPLGVPDFRARQLFGWLHRRLAVDFTAMTNLPATLREELAARYRLTVLREVRRATAEDGTAKYLFALPDGETIETVYMPGDARATLCLSTMVGCPFGCTFCATGQSGFRRNLTASEIVDQVYRVQAGLPEGVRISNLVYMGMGEPLANYDQTLRSVRLLLHPLGLNLSQRHITLSTVGIVPGIERLAEEGLQVNLAISLHSPFQADRVPLVPIAKKYPLDQLLTAARRYVTRTGRKVTFEYTVVPGRNDRPDDARELARLVRGLQALINVIPLNPTEGLPTGMSSTPARLLAAAEAFTDALKAQGVEAALRRSRGEEIAGACGQLRRRNADETPSPKRRRT